MKTEYELPAPSLYDANEDMLGYTYKQMQFAIRSEVLIERGEWLDALLPIVRSKAGPEQIREAVQSVIRNRSNK